MALEARFEVLPFERAYAQAAQLPAPAVLTVTCSPRHGPDQTVAFGARLRELGHTIVVHLAARMVRDRVHLDELLDAMARASVVDAFVIGGDANPPQGAYQSAGELLAEIAEHPQRPRTIGIAAYPEGHPLIDDQTLAQALRDKASVADYLTTQMCFDPETLLHWLRELRGQGFGLPATIGLPGAVDRRRLLEIGVRIGVGPSLSFLRKQQGLRQLLRRASLADRLFDTLVPRLSEPGLNVTGIHYFTFNQLLDTWNWERSKQAGGGPTPIALTTRRARQSKGTSE